MTKDVLLTISGFQDQFEEGVNQDEPIEVITPANYFFKNGKHYILYEEVQEGVPGVTKNKIKINGNQSIEIMKSGSLNTHMTFQEHQKNVSFYQTPYGEMKVGMTTKRIRVEESEEKIAVEMDYELEINEESYAECNLSMSIQPKGIRI